MFEICMRLAPKWVSPTLANISFLKVATPNLSIRSKLLKDVRCYRSDNFATRPMRPVIEFYRSPTVNKYEFLTKLAIAFPRAGRAAA